MQSPAVTIPACVATAGTVVPLHAARTAQRAVRVVLGDTCITRGRVNIVLRSVPIP